MKQPLKVHDGAFDWYDTGLGERAESADGAARLQGHWVPRSVFLKLQGGELFSLMGVRRYATAAEAVAALARAEKS